MKDELSVNEDIVLRAQRKSDCLTKSPTKMSNRNIASGTPWYLDMQRIHTRTRQRFLYLDFLIR